MHQAPSHIVTTLTLFVSLLGCTESQIHFPDLSTKYQTEVTLTENMDAVVGMISNVRYHPHSRLVTIVNLQSNGALVYDANTGALLDNISIPIAYTDSLFPVEPGVRIPALGLENYRGKTFYKISPTDAKGPGRSVPPTYPHIINDLSTADSNVFILAGVAGYLLNSYTNTAVLSRILVLFEYNMNKRAFETFCELPLFHTDYIFTNYSLSPYGQTIVMGAFLGDGDVRTNTDPTNTICIASVESGTLNFTGEREFTVLSRDFMPRVVWCSSRKFIYANGLDHYLSSSTSKELRGHIPFCEQLGGPNEQSQHLIHNVFPVGKERVGVYYSILLDKEEQRFISMHNVSNLLPIGVIRDGELCDTLSSQGRTIEYITGDPDDDIIYVLSKDSRHTYITSYSVELGNFPVEP